MQMIVLGHIGSDAGYWVLGPDGWHHVGGWGIEAIAEVQRAVGILAKTPELKTPGLANTVSQSLMKFVQKEVGAHVKDTSGGVIIVVNQA
jgi:hypothetical protein